MVDHAPATSETACKTCPRLLETSPAPRDRILATSRLVVAHAFNANLEGWLVVLPKRHVVSIDQFDDVEAAELGPLLSAVTGALRSVTGCSKTYVLLLAESEGFQHVHFHVVPRGPDLPEAFRGAGIFGLLGNPELEVVAPARMDELAIALRGHLAAAGVVDT